MAKNLKNMIFKICLFKAVDAVALIKFERYSTPKVSYKCSCRFLINNPDKK